MLARVPVYAVHTITPEKLTKKMIDIQNGTDTDPSNPKTILGVNPFFNTLTKEVSDFMFSKIGEFAEITARFGYIPEDQYAKVLMGKMYLDDCLLLKPGAKPLNEMVTNRQRNLVMSNEAFADQQGIYRWGWQTRNRKRLT